MVSTSTTSRFRRRKRYTPTREPTPEQRLYAIRDIRAEKWEQNRLLYLIDWADDSSTGETYDPTWEPAENATEDAVADWEAEKSRRRAAQRHSQRSSAELSSESDSQPVLSSNWRKRRRRSIARGNNEGRLSKRPRTTTNHTGDSLIGDPAEEDWSLAGPLPDNRGDIVLEIRLDPGFDPHEYLAISLSQPSQASQASQNVSFPAAASKTGEPEAQAKSGISQTTIPDSQEITDSLPSQFSADPLLGEASLIVQTEEITGSEQPPTGAASSIQPEPLSAEACGLDIPSGQPGTSLPRPFQYSIGPFEEQDDFSPGPAATKFKGLEANTSSQTLLTQPWLNLHPSIQISTPLPEAGEVDTNAPISSHDDCRITETDIVTPRNQSSHSHSPAIALPFNSQPAQIVQPLSSCSRQILTQVQDIFQSIESDIIPDTVLKPVPKGPGPTTRRAKSESEILFSTDISVGGAASPTIVRAGSAMDPFARDDSELSTADQLRAFRDSILAAPFYSSSHPPTDLTPAAAQPQEQSLISPSSVLPGTDNDGSGGSSKGLVDSSNLWHEAPTGISLRTLDMAFGAKPAETTSKEASLSAAKELAHDMNMQFPLENPTPSMPMPPSHFSAAHEHQPEFEQIPATVAPSDLTNASANLFALTADPLHSGDNHILGEDAGDHVDTLLSGPESDPYHPDSHSEHQHEDRPQGEFIVTLPMAANTRQLYLEQISGDNKRTMLDFATGFAKSLSWVPDGGLLAKMDRIFEHLLDLCDLPTWVHDMAKANLTPEAMWKHATGTNSKFSFVYEFLNAIKDLNTRVLILCHSGYAFQYLESLLSAPGFNYSILGGESAGEEVDGLAVILASADQQPSVVHGRVDIVINFDHVARAVDLSQVLPGAIEPLVLSLVVTHSIEHIDLQLGPEPGDLERKNAINLAIGSAKELLKSPERGFEPHDIAEIFAGFVRNPDHGFVWEPSTLPEHVLDLWLSSQAGTGTQEQSLNEQGMSDSLNNRKRRLDDDEIGTPKRARILDLSQLTRNRTPAQMSDLLKSTLATFSAAGSSPVQSVELPVHQLESMAAKIAELESRLASQNTIEGQYRDLIKTLESQVQSSESSVRKIQPKYMDAIRDRTIFEKENIAIKKQLGERDREIATLKDQKQALKAKLETPELDRLVTAEKELAEAQEKVQSLEKKIITTERDMEYSRGAYQTASTEASKLGIEKRDLISKITELEKRASENFLKVHKINSRNADEQYYRQLEEKNETIRERERDLERAREELRHIKNGRRETRQASVPRSPRPGAGVMSPRPPRIIGGQGPGSRPTSPPAGAGVFSETGGAGAPNAAASAGPGMTFLTQPTGNGRWGHLRD